MVKVREMAPAVTNRIDVTMGFDGAYAPHAAAVIAAVSRHADNAPFRFIILYENVSRDVQERIEKNAPGSSFIWREVGDEDVPAFESRRHLTRATLYRLGLEHLAPADCERLIYLDADITVLGDLRDLWSMDLKGCALGAVADGYLNTDHFEGKTFHQTWDLPEGEYFNAGILLIDLTKVRKEALFTKAMHFAAEHDEGLPYNDQDALNWTFWQSWQPLPVSWNVQASHLQDWAVAEQPVHRRLGGAYPDIVHFTGPEKPWIKDGYHPWSWVYWDSLKRTDFLREVSGKQGFRIIDRLRLRARWMRKHPGRLMQKKRSASHDHISGSSQ
ncbi:MAG: glycosyltransferase family 8 protein [Hyphomonas oceanitis]|uniref:glycosyltransferase family 8 protein n=1 Tax=Hyphomonas oceanitis TaxID=81033 RepID=UPI003001A732